jgi:hypothetical protein
VAHMQEKRMHTGVKEKGYFELSVGRRIILKWIIEQ